jgi:hypothetical protein
MYQRHTPIHASAALRKPRHKIHRLNKHLTVYFKKDGTLQDVVLVWIQIICVSLLAGCTFALFAKWCLTQSSATIAYFHPEEVGSNQHGKGQNQHGKFKLVPLKPSNIYTIPNSMSHIGDKSDEYAKLRKKYDAMDLPPAHQKLQFTPKPMNIPDNDQVAYDIYNCPEEPPHGYPYAWTMTDILRDWPADDTTPRSEIYQGLCVFDYTKDYDKAQRYRHAEVPFVVRNDPQVSETTARWTYPGYMQELLGEVMHRAEYSTNNHFMYWQLPPKDGSKNPTGYRRIHAPEGWTPPTKQLRMTYAEWISHAESGKSISPNEPHWYYRLIGCGEIGPEGQCDMGSSEYIFDELPFFQPKKSLYIGDPNEQRGIHCRFGMEGIIAENHFDSGRNSIALLGGERRYILTHPNQCEHLALYPKGHPSARHSAIDWSEPDLDEFPEFSLAKGNEVVMQAGDVLYLPNFWFHYIISLSTNFQCNTRSGTTPEYISTIKSCGF